MIAHTPGPKRKIIVVLDRPDKIDLHGHEKDFTCPDLLSTLSLASGTRSCNNPKGPTAIFLALTWLTALFVSLNTPSTQTQILTLEMDGLTKISTMKAW